MKITGKLNVHFYSYALDKKNDPSVNISDYHRIPGCLKVDYIPECVEAIGNQIYLKEKVSIKPGIYQVFWYDVPALLFIWKFNPKHHDIMMGMVVNKSDKESVKKVYARYKRALVLSDEAEFTVDNKVY